MKKILVLVMVLLFILSGCDKSKDTVLVIYESDCVTLTNVIELGYGYFRIGVLGTSVYDNNNKVVGFGKDLCVFLITKDSNEYEDVINISTEQIDIENYCSKKSIIDLLDEVLDDTINGMYRDVITYNSETREIIMPDFDNDGNIEEGTYQLEEIYNGLCN